VIRRLSVVAEEKEMTEATEAPGEESLAGEGVGGEVEVPQTAPGQARGTVESTAAGEARSVDEQETAPEGSARKSLPDEAPRAGSSVGGEVERPSSERVGRVPTLDELGPRSDVYYYGTGRRKTSSAQVRLYPSKEPVIIVNDKPVEEYFSRSADIKFLRRPLRATATEDSFRITVKVRGGGVTGQASAIRHGIARALTRANPEFRRTLRREGSLTRDPRMKERKKPGLKRARKAPQYTKR
jgi:small subunit ribosomal protein S9